MTQVLPLRTYACKPKAWVLMAHQMGGFNVDLAREKFTIPAQFTPMAMICVGYPADMQQSLVKHLRVKQQKRSRRPLSELFFANEWGSQLINSLNVVKYSFN